MLKNVALVTLFLSLGFLAAIFLVKRTPLQIVTTTFSTPSPTILPQVEDYNPDIPPQDSLQGAAVFSGKVNWQSRTATESAEISDSPQIIKQGESLETQKGALATVDFNKVGSITLLPETKVNFVQTLPVNLVFWQTAGIAEYKMIDNSPFSIRTMHLLINQNQGDIIVSIDKILPIVSITVKKGSIKIAYNDKNLVSQLIEVTQGKRIVFNDQTRRAVVR